MTKTASLEISFGNSTHYTEYVPNFLCTVIPPMDCKHKVRSKCETSDFSSFLWDKERLSKQKTLNTLKWLT